MEMKYVTFYQLIIIFLVCLCCIPNSFAASCQKEKEKADYWNNLMRQDKVTERRRERHREAKQTYLHCLNSAKKSSSPKKNNLVVAKSTVNSESKKKKKQKRYTITQDIKVSSYHNFKGNKRIAWESFFQESPECIHNTTNEKTFVKCAEERKVALSYFNARWSDSQQKLITLIE
ncbi:hypothetical protein J3L16_03125 [Alteromonas sp. 5E99-2]|uniref:hypothetical protein n=1 Tax=Alteromonas sp. 5E99-2 TaxID=2817683 RepID=UPI001A983B5C|nr:hypothetical protein [Alteromonas sp. 5E99-2]MBO1254676.1 hypothetical protein [Alteromonas sp. 5E99-2]